jgi:hypothetical protein
MLLPTATNRTLIMSITAVLLLFVTYLLTLPRNNVKFSVEKMLTDFAGNVTVFENTLLQKTLSV